VDRPARLLGLAARRAARRGGRGPGARARHGRAAPLRRDARRSRRRAGRPGGGAMVRLNPVVRDLLIVTAIAFMITAAVLLRYYVYPATLVLPLEQNRTYRLEASSAVYLDTTTYELRARSEERRVGKGMRSA